MQTKNRQIVLVFYTKEINDNGEVIWMWLFLTRIIYPSKLTKLEVAIGIKTRP